MISSVSSGALPPISQLPAFDSTKNLQHSEATSTFKTMLAESLCQIGSSNPAPSIHTIPTESSQLKATNFSLAPESLAEIGKATANAYLEIINIRI